MSGTSRKSIAFLMNNTFGNTSYESDLWTGAHDGAVARDCDLTIICGDNFVWHRAGSAEPVPGNLVYDLFDPGAYDGIVFCTAAVTQGLSNAEVAGFVRGFGDTPFVMVHGLPGERRSLVDNKAGARELVEHMIEVHGKRRIAYIRGPVGTDADERFEAYAEALRAAGIEPDPALVYEGNFIAPSGAAAVAEFLDARGVDFDAVCCANDGMAFGAIEALRARGRKVPRDVPVLGFDDCAEAAFHDPPLTTVRQPVYMQARRALEMVCDIVDGRAGPMEETLKTETVFRQSCGCSLGSLEAHGGRGRRPAVEGAAAVAGEAESRIIRLAKEAVAAGSASAADAVAGSFAELVSAVAGDVAEVRRWAAFARSSRGPIAAAAADAEAAALADVLALKLDLVANEALVQAEGADRLRSARQNLSLRLLAQQLGAAFDTERLLAILDGALAANGVPGYSVALFDGGDPVPTKVFSGSMKRGAGTPGTLRQLGANVDGTRVPPQGPARFPARALFLRAPFAGRRRSHVVRALFFGREKLGVVALEVGTREGNAYDAVATQLSTSLMGERLFEGSQRSERAHAERSDRIEKLVLPMIGSLEKVAALATEKSRATEKLAAAAKESQRKLDGTIGTLDKVALNIKQMAELIGVIDEISVTINLVSLNASIEASHAGSYGKGFAVIAKEIKKLAESTQAKADEITASLAELRRNMTLTAEAGRASLESYREEEAGVKRLLEAFAAITSDMEALAGEGRKIIETMKA